MIRLKYAFSCLILVIVLCIGNYAFGIPLQVVGLDASATSITLPTLPGPAGSPSTGDISILLTPGFNVTGTLDQTTGEGLLFWPARINFPLLQSFGKDPIDTVLVGPFFTSEPDNFLIAFDMGFIDDPTIGRAYIANNNKNEKNVPILLACSVGTTVTGSFVDIGQADYDRLEKDRLRGMMDQSLSALRAFDPSVPSIGSDVLDTIKSMYDSDPNTELIMFFPDAPVGHQFRTSQLSGTDALQCVPEPATMLLVGTGLIGLAGFRKKFKKR